MKILAINPGSTSTKISVYDDENKVFETTIRHIADDLKKFNSIQEQYEWRRNIIVETIEKNNISIDSLSAVVGRGGLIRPVSSGTYKVNDKMIADLKSSKFGEHASNLGAIIAKSIADSVNIGSFIVDPVVVDELLPVARVSGLKGVERRSLFHALNQKAVAELLANELKVEYEKSSFIIVHMGGGTSIAAHKNGKVIDVTNGLDGEGPFTPERTGALPVSNIIKMCFSGEYTQNEMFKKLSGLGGVVSYLGTNNLMEVQTKALNGDENSSLIIEAMCYQVAKDIGAMATVLHGKVDAIALTGGIANGKEMMQMIKEKISFIANVYIYKGEEEMLALTKGCLRALNNSDSVKEY